MPSRPMNPGLKGKSAAKDSKFPCSYADCTKGFARAEDLKRHKDDDHWWCATCDVDCEDDVALIEHRIESTLANKGKHIACWTCGDDFRCEAGRNLHMQLAHREVQEIICPGCNASFERAAALLAHVQNDKCKDRSGLVTSAALCKGRADAALELERLVTVASGGERDTDNGSVNNSSARGPGGIDAESLLDSNNEAPEQETYGSDENLHNDGKGDDVSTTYDAPDGYSNSNSKNTGWAKTLFPDAKSTPVTGDWTPPKLQPKVLHGGRGAAKNSRNSNNHTLPTNWDAYVFEHDPMDRVKCPFQRCNSTYPDEAAVKAHLISGFHQSTAQHCVKCLKMFRNPVALLAHMESPSTRCNVRHTQQYAHIVHLVTGGFVDVNDDERGTRLPDGNLRLRARTKSELAEQQVQREEEQRARLEEEQKKREEIREQQRRDKERQIAEQW